ncbi:MAG: hypothetical protein ACRDO0_15280 [Nocardioidaceae bacterium]
MGVAERGAGAAPQYRRRHPGADRLYRRNGFAYTGEDGPPMPDGAPQRVMAKHLQPLPDSQ